MADQVFISYAHDDRDWAARLAQELSTRGFAPFLDYNSLRDGQGWEDQLLVQLDQCDHLVVLWSKLAQASDWVGRERGRFDAKRYKGKQRLPGHVMVHVQLDNRESAYSSDQAITEIDAAAYAKGAANLPAATWGNVADRVATAFGENSVPIATAVITVRRNALVDDEDDYKVDFKFRPAGGRTLTELLDDIPTTKAELAEKFYGTTREDWKPFGGESTIAQIMEKMRVALNAPAGVTPVRWVPVDDDLFSNEQEAIKRAAATLASGLALVLIDPISLYSQNIRTLLDRLAQCYQNPHAALVVLPIFAEPKQPRAHHDMVRQVYQRLMELFYEDPPLPARIEYAQCSVLAADDADVRRVVRSALRHYIGQDPKEDDNNKFLRVGRG